MPNSYDYDPSPRVGRKYAGMSSLPPVASGLVADMKRYLLNRRLDYGVATFNGWYPSNQAGDTLPRIVIPGTMGSEATHVVTPGGASHHMTSRGTFWQARTLVGGEPRYQSPGGERNGAVIVVRPYAATDRAVVVEGPMDALVAAMRGQLGIAVMGNNPGMATLETVARCVRPSARSVLFVPDLDSPGAFAVALGVLAAGGFRCEMRIPPQKDLAACDDGQRKAVLR